MKDIERQREPKLTGINLVLKEQMYANAQFPQTGFAISSATLNALFSSEHPEKLIEEFLLTPLPQEKLQHMLERANKAHEAYLPEEQRPVLTEERMAKLWETDQFATQKFILDILDVPSNQTELAPYDMHEEAKYVIEMLQKKPFPIDSVRACLNAVTSALRDPEILAQLVTYRELFRGEEFWSEDEAGVAQAGELQKEIRAKVMERARAVISANPNVDPKVAWTVFDHLEDTR